MPKLLEDVEDEDDCIVLVPSVLCRQNVEVLRVHVVLFLTAAVSVLCSPSVSHLRHNDGEMFFGANVYQNGTHQEQRENMMT